MDDFTGCRNLAQKTRVLNSVNVAVGMDAAIKGKQRPGVNLNIFVAENAKLKKRYQIVVKFTFQFDLGGG